MKSSVKIVQVSLVVALISGIVVGVPAAVTLAILAGGWVVNWMFPTIPYEFASIIAGQGLLIAGLLLAVAISIAVKAIASHESELKVLNGNDSDDDIDEDTDSDEAAEWLAERIADITHAKLTQTAPKSRRYTAKPRGK